MANDLQILCTGAFASRPALIFILAACAALDSPPGWGVVILGREMAGHHGRDRIVEAILGENIHSSVFSVNFLASSAISKARAVFQKCQSCCLLTEDNFADT